MTLTDMCLAKIGAVCFGAVIGWVVSGAYVAMTQVTLPWIASLIGIIGGGAVVAVFNKPELFGAYCIGLAIAFFPGVFFQGAPGRKFGKRVWSLVEKENI
jgi:hypothetical protein